MVFGDEKNCCLRRGRGSRILLSFMTFCLWLSGMTAYTEVYHYPDSESAVNIVADISGWCGYCKKTGNISRYK